MISLRILYLPKRYIMNFDRLKIEESIRNGTEYLRKQLFTGNYGLSCLGLDGTQKFSNSKGHLFSIFHIVNALKGEISEIERTIFLMRIISEENNGHWGYSPRGYYKETQPNPFFVDSDDTSFALRTLRQLNVYKPNDSLCDYHHTLMLEGFPCSVFTTFQNGNTPSKITNEGSFLHNFEIHPEVNANIFHTLIDSTNDHLISNELIKLTQNEDGSWKSFFYPNALYSTFQFMDLLQKIKVLQPSFEKGMKYILFTQNSDGGWGTHSNSYSTALALKILELDFRHHEQINKAIKYLLHSMHSDGSWSTTERIWEFHDLDGDIWSAYDNQKVITTALCVDALKQIYFNADFNACAQ